MTEWFFEIRSGEIPALMQRPAAAQLEQLLSEILNQQRLEYTLIKSFVTPTRLGACVSGLAFNQKDSYEERRGPRIDAPQTAIDGFLNSTGAKLQELEQRTLDKGQFYFHTENIKGQKTVDVLSDILDQILTRFKWPKSMLWNYGNRTWIRPINGGCSVFNGISVNYEFQLNTQNKLEKVILNNQTVGHRFLSNIQITVSSFDEYCKALHQHHVMIDPKLRAQEIMNQINKICTENDLTLDHDTVLLEEVTGLVEFPFVYLGQIESRFMALPPEVLRTSMRVHQRYFSVKDKQGNMAPYFIIVANIPGQDNGKILLAGNARVLKARLSDASFFFQQDRQKTLSQHAEQLNKLVFHGKLGTIQEKNERLEVFKNGLALESRIADNLTKVIHIAKADLVTTMVKEFPELQGIMGARYAEYENDLYDNEVSSAVRDQYFSQSNLPINVTGKLYYLIDRIDTLVGFFMLGIQPTGSKDPFALRRAALGIIRILEDQNSGFDVPIINMLKLDHLIDKSFHAYSKAIREQPEAKSYLDTKKEVEKFLLERLKVYWRDQGFDHDQINSVLNFELTDALSLVKKKLSALQDFKKNHTEDYNKILSLSKRILNILNHDKNSLLLDQSNNNSPNNNNMFFATNEFESDLYSKWEHSATNKFITELNEFLSSDNFFGFIKLITEQCDSINQFFEHVIILSENEDERNNRLLILELIKSQLVRITDFSKLES